MKMTRVLTPLAIAVAALVSAQNAAAGFWEEGDYVVRVGASWIDPDDGDDQLKFRDTWLNEGFDVDADTTWNISGAWLPAEHWGVELMYIGETNHDMELERVRDGNLIYDIDSYDVGSFDASYANAFVNWYILPSTCMGRPYVGIGVNYTDFSDEGFSRRFNDLLIDEDLILTDASVGMGHSWGVTGQVGVDFRFGRDSAFLVNAALLYIDTDSDFNVYYKDPRSDDPALTRRVSVNNMDFSPWVFNLGVGYSF
ncbi:outer membrane beta-barrel protein [Microbulbifer bruguierae]|uniref:Outer membrane beta-barrel protein n=1 Tax=Microbulbifer bruguierae TaxID=3029061 RepID=A0ABY8NFN4_9GAMM|nr:OmpW family outer membrane protein [Microbulbifer bruguierae]WGL17485.1 outer membrane beta-barrel protein [Microbulbifer bruguierae]